MTKPNVALIETQDFITFGYPLTSESERYRRNPLTPWGVKADIVERLFRDGSGAVLTTHQRAAELIVAAVTVKPSLTVMHVDTDRAASEAVYPHLDTRYVGIDKAPVLSNCHRAMAHGNNTLHFEDTAARDSAYVNRGSGLPGVEDANTFFRQSLSFADRPGRFNTFSVTYFQKELLMFGGSDCAGAIREVLESRGFTFQETPQGWERYRMQQEQIQNALDQGATWPRTAS